MTPDDLYDPYGVVDAEVAVEKLITLLGSEAERERYGFDLDDFFECLKRDIDTGRVIPADFESFPPLGWSRKQGKRQRRFTAACICVLAARDAMGARETKRAWYAIAQGYCLIGGLGGANAPSIAGGTRSRSTWPIKDRLALLLERHRPSKGWASAPAAARTLTPLIRCFMDEETPSVTHLNKKDLEAVIQRFIYRDKFLNELCNKKPAPKIQKTLLRKQGPLGLSSWSSTSASPSGDNPSTQSSVPIRQDNTSEAVDLGHVS